MLYLPPGSGMPQRIHGAFVSDAEVHRVVEHLQAQGGRNTSRASSTRRRRQRRRYRRARRRRHGGRPMYDQAVAVVLKTRRPRSRWCSATCGSATTRARLIEQMDAPACVGDADQRQPRGAGSRGQGVIVRARVLLFTLCLSRECRGGVARPAARVRARDPDAACQLHANGVRRTGPANRAGERRILDRATRPFRWNVDKPYKQLLVGDGDRVWIYDPDLNQVISRKSDKALGSTPAALLSGRDEVEAAFDWREQPGEGWARLASPRRPRTRTRRFASSAWLRQCRTLRAGGVRQLRSAHRDPLQQARAQSQARPGTFPFQASRRRRCRQ